MVTSYMNKCKHVYAKYKGTWMASGGVYAASIIYIKYYTTHSQLDLDPRKKMQQPGKKNQIYFIIIEGFHFRISLYDRTEDRSNILL